MKSVINVESILVLMVVYFIMGDPLSLAPLFSSLIGKFFILMLLIIFSSYNLIYGLVFLVLLLHIDENRIEGMENYAMNKDYKHVSSAVMKSLEVFKCNSNNESLNDVKINYLMLNFKNVYVFKFLNMIIILII